MQLHEAKYKAANGKKYVRYTVRSIRTRSGVPQGFGVLDILQNVIVNHGFGTRAEARQWLADEQEKQAAKELADAATN